MIPRDYITQWRAQAPWVQDIQVEQDLVISRALVAIFSHPLLADALASRAGRSRCHRAGSHEITRALFEENIQAKLRDRQFTADIGPMLADGYSWDIKRDADSVSDLITRLPGAPWKGEG